ncbi:MAG: YHS domain-containing protein [Desulfobaccales bacterium]
MKRVIISMILALALAFASAGPVMAAGATQGLQDKSGTVQPGAQQAVCPVLGNKINKNIYTDYQGQRIYFCCPGCIDVFKKNPEACLKKMEEQGVAPEKTSGGK